MFVIGLLIVVAVAVFVGFVISENWGGDTFSISGFNHTLGHLTLAQVFIAGIASAAVFFVALWLAAVSSRMRRRASKSRRAEARAAREERDSLRVDRDRLAAELADERAKRPVAAPVVVNAPPPVVVPDAVVAGSGAGAIAVDQGRTAVIPAVVTLPEGSDVMSGVSPSGAGLGAVPGSGFHREPGRSKYDDEVALDESRRHTV